MAKTINGGLMFNVADPFVVDVEEFDYRDGYCSFCDDGPCTCPVYPMVSYKEDRRVNQRIGIEKAAEKAAKQFREEWAAIAVKYGTKDWHCGTFEVRYYLSKGIYWRC